MTSLINPRDFKPIEITGKDTSERPYQSGGERVAFTFILSQKPPSKWISYFEEYSRGQFKDVSFLILDNKVQIHLGKPRLLQQAYNIVKNNVLPRTNSKYHVEIEKECEEQQRASEESKKKLKQGEDEFEKLEL